MGDRKDAGLSLLFAQGDRPGIDDVRQLLEKGRSGDAGFSISHQPPVQEGWLELLSSGLTFDFCGLVPSAAPPRPSIAQYIGIPETPDVLAMEPVTLKPGPHLAGGEAMIPVIRVMVALAGQLAEALGARAIYWHPSGCCMDARYFSRVAEDWLFGGAFPALGLTSIRERAGGGVESQGLAFFIGQEVSVDALPREPTSEAVKLAVRAIDHLVRNGPLRSVERYAMADDEWLVAEPSGDGRKVKLRREG